MAGTTDSQLPGKGFRRTRRCVLLLLLLAGPSVFADDITKIVPSGYVTDLAGVVPSESRERLEALAGELDRKAGAQLAVVTVRSLDGRPVEDYAVDLFKHLGVGAKKSDSGVLLLLAPNDRKYRIEVGYGLESVINDARAGDAGRAMVPLLRQNDYGSAVEVAAWQLARWIADDRGVTLSGRAPERATRPRGNRTSVGPFAILLLLLIVFWALSSGARSAYGGRRGGGMDGCWWILPLLGGGRGGWGGGRGWGGGGWGGGGFGGGGGGFGGFGGGSSGGGGASGSW
jgi:uncharacterized protein